MQREVQEERNINGLISRGREMGSQGEGARRKEGSGPSPGGGLYSNFFQALLSKHGQIGVLDKIFAMPLEFHF
jgi:hypothetical protein